MRTPWFVCQTSSWCTFFPPVSKTTTQNPACIFHWVESQRGLLDFYALQIPSRPFKLQGVDSSFALDRPKTAIDFPSKADAAIFLPKHANLPLRRRRRSSIDNSQHAAHKAPHLIPFCHRAMPHSQKATHSGSGKVQGRSNVVQSSAALCAMCIIRQREQKSMA